MLVTLKYLSGWSKRGEKGYKMGLIPNTIEGLIAPNVEFVHFQKR